MFENLIESKQKRFTSAKLTIISVVLIALGSLIGVVRGLARRSR